MSASCHERDSWARNIIWARRVISASAMNAGDFPVSLSLMSAKYYMSASCHERERGDVHKHIFICILILSDMTLSIYIYITDMTPSRSFALVTRRVRDSTRSYAHTDIYTSPLRSWLDAFACARTRWTEYTHVYNFNTRTHSIWNTRTWIN